MRTPSHLVLVGPMGAGKSTLGRRLARRWGLPFVDLDREIESRAGADTPTLFAREGEAGFRRRERETLAAVLDGPACVLATGGGAVLDPDSRARMRRHGFVVWLRIGVEEQLRRLAGDTGRPLIAGDDREAVLRRLAAEREPLYGEVADLQFAPTGDGPAETAARLADLLDGRWRQPAPLSSATNPT